MWSLSLVQERSLQSNTSDAKKAHSKNNILDRALGGTFGMDKSKLAYNINDRRSVSDHGRRARLKRGGK